MSLQTITLAVAHPGAPERAQPLNCALDRVTVYTVVPASILAALGIEPHSTREFFLASGGSLVRSLGTAALEYEGRRGDSVVVFGEEGDPTAAGVATLQLLGLLYDPSQRLLKSLPVHIPRSGTDAGEGRAPVARSLVDAIETVICAECGSPMRLRPSRFGDFYGCTRWPRCDGAHGAHPDGRPLGVPASKQTKRARMSAHAEFDRLWKSGLMRRDEAYAFLAEIMEIPRDQAHIGQFTCEQAEELVRRLRRWSAETDRGLEEPGK